VSTELEEDILRSLRRITRAIDLHSRQLASTYGLTGPQLVALRTVSRRGPLSPSALAKRISLSNATVTGIVDRLAARQLVTRERSSQDRRLVTVAITDAGRSLIAAAPSPLQDTFVERLAALSPEEQTIIRVTLGKIVRMMDGEELAAAPILSTSSADLSGSEIVPEVATASSPIDPAFDEPDE
jgi:DNA-binding MarR family transcriptional regulator